MEPRSPSKRKLSLKGVLGCHQNAKLWVILVVIVLVLGGVYYWYDMLFMKSKSCFSVVVDCGSTGTRVNVFEWRMNGRRNGELPVLLHSYPDDSMKSLEWSVGCHYHCMQKEPGLDKFVGNYSGVRDSLEPLIRWAEGLVPIDRRKDTPILVLGTAGLRRLKMEDARCVLEDVEFVVKECSFMWRREWIRVLSGKEEAYYGWVALNYKMGYLRKPPRAPMLGLLDLGGSSLQVVMEAGKEREEDRHHLVSKIGVVEHQLMAYSLPAFGLNKAFDRTVAMISQVIMGNEARSEVRHPCLSSRFSSNYSCSSCSMKDPLRLVGDPNWEKCKLLAQAAAMNMSISDLSDPKFGSSCPGNSCDDGNNPLNITISTNPGVQYHALSGFFAVYNMLNLTAKANLTKVWEKARLFCSDTWDVQGNVPGSQYCFKVLYLTSLIKDSLCLGEAGIIFGPGDISWTLGAALIEGEPMRRSSTEALAVITPQKYMAVVPTSIFLFVILAVMLFIVYHFQIKLPMPKRRSLANGALLPSYNHSKHRPH